MLQTVVDFLLWPVSLVIWIWKKLTNKIITLPKPDPINPTFILPEDLKVDGYNYNPHFYATEETALAVQKRFDAMVSFIKPVVDADRQAPAQWFVRFTDGLEVNVGQLARFFAAYPEDKYPGVAMQFGIAAVAMERENKVYRERVARRGAFRQEEE